MEYLSKSPEKKSFRVNKILDKFITLNYMFDVPAINMSRKMSVFGCRKIYYATRRAMYTNATIRRVRETIVAVEKQ